MRPIADDACKASSLGKHCKVARALYCADDHDRIGMRKVVDSLGNVPPPFSSMNSTLAGRFTCLRSIPQSREGAPLQASDHRNWRVARPAFAREQTPAPRGESRPMSAQQRGMVATRV